MRKFAIYYNDGSVVEGGGDNDDIVMLTFSKKWLEAPSDGVACVVYDNAITGRSKLFASEFYYQLPYNHHGEGSCGSSMKIGAYLRQTGLVKYGGWTDETNHNNRLTEASKNTYVNPVSAKRKEPQEDTSD